MRLHGRSDDEAARAADPQHSDASMKFPSGRKGLAGGTRHSSVLPCTSFRTVRGVFAIAALLSIIMLTIVPTLMMRQRTSETLPYRETAIPRSSSTPAPTTTTTTPTTSTATPTTMAPTTTTSAPTLPAPTTSTTTASPTTTTTTTTAAPTTTTTTTATPTMATAVTPNSTSPNVVAVLSDTALSQLQDSSLCGAAILESIPQVRCAAAKMYRTISASNESWELAAEANASVHIKAGDRLVISIHCLLNSASQAEGTTAPPIDSFLMSLNLSFSARAYSTEELFSGVIHEVSGHSGNTSQRVFEVEFGPFMSEKTVSEGSGVSEGPMQNVSYTVDVVWTYVGPLYLGQKWRLTSQGSESTFQLRKDYCTSLTLHGPCERFGVTLYRNEHVHVSSQPTNHAQELRTGGGSLPSCAGNVSAAFAAGAWRGFAPKEGTSEYEVMQRLLDDHVGLNRFNSRVWRWHSQHCQVRLFSRVRAMECLRQRNVTQVTLVGDSLMMEMFFMLVHLLSGTVAEADLKAMPQEVSKFGSRHGPTGRRFRYRVPPLSLAEVESLSTIGNASSKVPSSESPLLLQFLRSYTTSHGRSVILPAQQLAFELQHSIRDTLQNQLVFLNLAMLHFQQNMMTEDQWEGYLKTFVQETRAVSASAHENLANTDGGNRSSDLSRLWYFWGPTQIQMGRTRGLEPSRTLRFGRIAREMITSGARMNVSSAANSEDGVAAFINPLFLTQSRRESAYDGQHWACLHSYGGVAQTLLHTFLSGFCPDI